jgi:large subunit ribosomal protein L32
MKLDMPGTTTCPKCGAAIKSHRACPECGNYKGKEVIKTTKTEE